MYQYNQIDQKIVDERVAQFRDQVDRRLSGQLSEDEFRPLRLMNGLYLQRHAYMLRVAIPYGLLSSTQVRKLARIARTYDRDYGHITTRQNIQYNWPKLAEVPDLLAELATVEMHAIQTSGNCIRNISADQYAGVARDELEDPRPYAEIMRQWSTFHPEFSYLPRKFKIAITGAAKDRAAVFVHDIGVRIVEGENGERGFQMIVGGGLGRTPIIGAIIREFLPKEHLLSYCEAILRVYNLHGNRENKYKARIKILVKTLGPDEFRRQVEEEWNQIKDSVLKVTDAELKRVEGFFKSPDYDPNAATADATLRAEIDSDIEFAQWVEHNTVDHKIDGYHIAVISLKTPARPPGDITADQLDLVADIAEAHSFGQIRTTHEQNLVLTDVASADLYTVWKKLNASELGLANHGKITDLICCPGLDFCSLANAGSLSVAKEITDKFQDLQRQYDLKEIQLKMSGCINACGHHHVGHIGILGVNKAGEEWYQIMLGGSATEDPSLGKWIGPAISKQDIAGAVETIVDVYVSNRTGDERLLDTYRRLGKQPFKEAIYESD